MKTYYAPAERSNEEEIKEKYEKLSSSAETVFYLNSAPEVYTILNENRQIVFANKAALDFLNVSEINNALGLRPGEAASCKHAFENEGGCGTSEFCRECGAVNSILTALGGEQNDKECRIVTQNNDAVDLRVYSTPLTFNNEKYVVFAAKDISSEKRKEVLERIFFHDILNTAGSLKSYSEMITNFELDKEEEVEFKDTIYNLSIRLIDEIRSQRILSNAENNSLQVNKNEINVSEFINRIVKDFKRSFFATDKYIQEDINISENIIQTDETLLSRVMINMLKNALEASIIGDIVTIGVHQKDNEYKFFVNNPAIMPSHIKLQIFQRSFSTKGVGRGIGTYSIKLLGEKYLGGKIDFTSEQDTGTTFFLLLDKGTL